MENKKDNEREKEMDRRGTGEGEERGENRGERERGEIGDTREGRRESAEIRGREREQRKERGDGERAYVCA